MLSFDYYSWKRHDGVVKAPLIPVTLRGDNGLSFNTVGLLDSGADTSCIPLSVAELLGLDLSNTSVMSGGIGGDVAVFPTKVTMVLSHQRFNFRRRFSVFVVPDGRGTPVILGRHPWFENFEARFIQKDFKIKLKPYNSDLFSH